MIYPASLRAFSLHLMLSNVSTEFSQTRRNVTKVKFKVKVLTNLSQFIIHISYFSFSIDLQ